MDRTSAKHAAQVLWQHLAPLRPYLDDPAVQEVMVNSPDDVWVESQGEMRRLDLVLESDQVDAVIKILANLNNKPDALILDCRLPGLRIAAARHPVAVRGHAMCIRKHAARKITLAHYVETGAFDTAPGFISSETAAVPLDMLSRLQQGGQGLADYLAWAVKARKPLLIGGSTSSGKTTLVGALLDQVDPVDRLIVIEDTGELSELHFDLPNRVHLEANESVGVSIRDLVKLALRFRPTRIIVGETRGAEAFDVMNAYNSGHPGGMVTLHADNAVQTLVAIETRVRMSPDAKDMPLASLRAQIAETFPIVIHATNAVGLNAPRAPDEIIHVTGVEPGISGFYRTERLYSRFFPSAKR